MKEKDVPGRPGRPAVFRTQEEERETLDRIFLRLVLGETMTTVCKDLGIDRSTIWRRITANPGFRDAYKRARELQAHALVDRALEIAADSSKDTYIDSEGRRRIDHDNISRAKLRVNFIKWFAGKIAPHIYGNRPNATAEPGGRARSNLTRSASGTRARETRRSNFGEGTLK